MYVVFNEILTLSKFIFHWFGCKLKAWFMRNTVYSVVMVSLRQSICQTGMMRLTWKATVYSLHMINNIKYTILTFSYVLSLQVVPSLCQSVTQWTAPRWSARVQGWATMSEPISLRHSQWTPPKLEWPHCRSACKDPKVCSNVSVHLYSWLKLMFCDNHIQK